jgi:putative nucleotidyltransferase with HDIG domain
MVKMLHERDPYTAEHSEEVADLAEKIARDLGLPEDQIETIRAAALVHDIGKVGIPDTILNKPGPLDEPEWQLIKKHTLIGFDLLKNLEMYSEAAQLVKYEHERWDGSGYPEGPEGRTDPPGRAHHPRRRRLPCPDERSSVPRIPGQTQPLRARRGRAHHSDLKAAASSTPRSSRP